jgi:hypothetical protein
VKTIRQLMEQLAEAEYTSFWSFEKIYIFVILYNFM